MDLQLIIKIWVNNRNKGKIETDSRVVKSNYSSRAGYSIESVLLKKWLIYNHSKLSREITVYNMTDLEVCYNRQLANLSSIVEEIVGVERKIT